MNNDLRRVIVEMITKSGEGHIPSAFSIIDILAILYKDILKFDSQNPDWKDRDYFILSKGHGSAALYVLLEKYGFISKKDLDLKSKKGGILGGHPDVTKVPGAEASTGSLGHGFPFAVGVALGLRITKMNNKVYVLVGDGECHEGTVWEAANVTNNLQLGNVCVIVDWNDSAVQLMPRDDLPAKWEAFGWKTIVIDGHSEAEIQGAFKEVKFQSFGQPTVIIAKTIKGKGVPMLEGHGLWHYKIPDKEELQAIMEVLS